MTWWKKKKKKRKRHVRWESTTPHYMTVFSISPRRLHYKWLSRFREMCQHFRASKTHFFILLSSASGPQKRNCEVRKCSNPAFRPRESSIIYVASRAVFTVWGIFIPSGVVMQKSKRRLRFFFFQYESCIRIYCHSFILR